MRLLMAGLLALAACAGFSGPAAAQDAPPAPAAETEYVLDVNTGVVTSRLAKLEAAREKADARTDGLEQQVAELKAEVARLTELKVKAGEADCECGPLCPCKTQAQSAPRPTPGRASPKTAVVEAGTPGPTVFLSGPVSPSGGFAAGSVCGPNGCAPAVTFSTTRPGLFGRVRRN